MRLRISETVGWLVYTPGEPNRHGVVTDAWTDPVERGIYAFNPGTTGDVALAGHDRDFEKPAVYVPTSWAPSHRDKIIARGIEYEVDGEPKRFRNPHDARMNHNQVDLKRTGG